MQVLTCFPDSGWRKSYGLLHIQPSTSRKLWRGKWFLFAGTLRVVLPKTQAQDLRIIHFDIAFPFISPEHGIPIQQWQNASLISVAGITKKVDAFVGVEEGNFFGISQMGEIVVFPKRGSGVGGMEGSCLFLDNI